MAYTTIDDPSAYFKVQLYSGTGSAQSITFDDTDTDMQPDLVWCKGRDSTNNHTVFDSVRGTGRALYPNRDLADESQPQGVTAFNSDGFSVGTLADLNNSSGNLVSWNWKESATAGFDIVSYTGNGSARTISHSLSAVPKMYMIKNRGEADSWQVYHGSNTSAPETDYLQLNENGATGDSDARFNDTAPTSSVFSVGDHVTVNKNTINYIAYVFAEKQGFSKFGSYTGNGSLDGPFLALSFLPSFFLVKRTDNTGNWVIFDNKRSSTGGFNEIGYTVIADGNNAEATGTTSNDIDFLSNGIKIREDNGDLNASGATYIYAAFAEAPFVNSNGVPCNAR
jgi:hypothetical protein